LENATKRLLTPILISRNTMEQIRGDADVHKLCQAKLRGISSPVELYELRGLNIDRQRQKLMHDIESMENVLRCLSVDALQDADQAWHSVKTLDELQQEIQNSGLEPEDGRPVPRIVDLTHI
jgi:hypothetical protein